MRFKESTFKFKGFELLNFGFRPRIRIGRTIEGGIIEASLCGAIAFIFYKRLVFIINERSPLKKENLEKIKNFKTKFLADINPSTERSTDLSFAKADRFATDNEVVVYYESWGKAIIVIFPLTSGWEKEFKDQIID